MQSGLHLLWQENNRSSAKGEVMMQVTIYLSASTGAGKQPHQFLQNSGELILCGISESVLVWSVGTLFDQESMEYPVEYTAGV